MAQGASVITDGATATHVTVDSGGHAVVDIAAPISDGISHNRFTRLNVTAAGLDFDNTLRNSHRGLLKQPDLADFIIFDGRETGFTWGNAMASLKELQRKGKTKG